MTLPSNLRTTSGTYVRTMPDAATVQRLTQWMEEHGIPNPVPAFTLHSSLIYSTSFLPEQTGDRTYTATVSHLGMLFLRGRQKFALVLMLDSPSLSARHAELVELGGTNEFADYHPHLTVSADVEGFLWENVPVPDFELHFVGEDYRPLITAA